MVAERSRKFAHTYSEFSAIVINEDPVWLGHEGIQLYIMFW